MDLDALQEARAAGWDRLDRLARARHLTGAEADELIERYQSASSDLAAVTSAAGRTPVGDWLSTVLTRARSRFAGTPTGVLDTLPRLFTRQIPAALWRIRWLTVWIAGAFLVVATAYGVWAAGSPQLMASLGSEAQLDAYARDEFVAYYSEHPTGVFASLVWTNNAWIATLSIVLGISGFFVPMILIQNAQNVGLAAAVMGTHGELDTFFAYISPHGPLELMSIFVAAAAGLRVFWAWVAPGPRTRPQALAEDGRALFAVVIAVVVSLLVSGVIEGFVTRQPWPWPVKTGIGALALAGFLLVQWAVGRRAAAAGHTGDLERFEAGATRLVAG